MMLRSIDFIQSENKPLEWRLEGLTLRQINLIVGKNACGKSKALGAVSGLARLVSGLAKPRNRGTDMSCSVRLVNGADQNGIEYQLNVVDSRVTREHLAIGGISKVARGAGGVGQIYFDKLSKELEFQSPEGELACVSRRDSIQHPYLDPLYEWGRALLSYRFNSLELGKHNLISISDISDGEQSSGKNVEESYSSAWPVQFVYKAGADEFGDGFKASLLSDMRQLDYLLADVGVRVYENLPNELREKGADDLVCLYVAEEGLNKPITQFGMSDGMFRALSILIHVTYAAMSGKPSCVIIDDIGEGLDYERSYLLIKILVEKAQKTGIQLIMATNDRFVMNNVPLEYWTVLSRERTERGTRVKVYNYETHKKVFDEFAYTGLNNFDFFATRFFEEGLGERT